jgi:phosphotriesterase-related protein
VKVSIVETVRGPVSVESLGRVLMHEHVFILSPEFLANYPKQDGFDETVEVPKAAERLNELKAAGIDTIVDLTVVGLGRYVPRVQAVSLLTEINIIGATGLYTYNEVPMFIHVRGMISGSQEDVLVGLFVQDIVEGIAETGVKAGILKCATDEQGVTEGVEVVLRAVARAHRQTGVPVSTHTHALTRRGLEQQDVFESEGVDLSRVIIGHSGDTTDVSYLEELIRRGSYIGMDRFGLDPILSFEDRVATVVEMCQRGHANRMVLSHDTSCFMDFVDAAAVPGGLPTSNFLHISRDVIPELSRRGVTDGQIDQMLVVNPRDIFARDRKKY